MIILFIAYDTSKHYALDHMYNWIEHSELPDCEVIIRCDRGEYNKDLAIKKQREWGRQLAVDKGATHLFYVDSDTVPPLDALPRLLAHGVDVISGLYHGRIHLPNEITTVAWKQSDPTKQFLNVKGLVEVDGAGLGCTLLSRKAFSSFNFFEWADPSDDHPMYDMLRAKGFATYLDTTVVCRHYSAIDEYA